jgi:hypothetical protein
VIADISAGHHAGADVLFLIATVLFAVAAALAALRRPETGILVPGGLALLALAWLLL